MNITKQFDFVENYGDKIQNYRMNYKMNENWHINKNLNN